MDKTKIIDIPEKYRNQPTKLRYKTFEAQINTEFDSVDFGKNNDLDITGDYIYTMQITADIDEQAYNRGTFSLRINEKEVYPSLKNALPVKIFMAGNQCNPSERYTFLGLPQIQEKFEAIYTDNSHPVVAFTPYKVFLHLVYYTNTD